MAPSPSTTSQTQTYYDDPSTNKFYTLLWGGQDIHIGIYPSSSNSTNDASPPSIPTASHATVTHMTQTLLSTSISLTPQTRILDLGAGYGGSARHLAKTYGCEVVCLNLSRLQNERNEQLCKEEDVSDKIKVIEGSFEAVPPSVGSEFDIIWSQDSFLHSRSRDLVISEIDRLLKPSPSARVIFTDIMASEDAFSKQPKLMSTMMSRLHLEDLATVKFYKTEFEQRGFKFIDYWDGKMHFRTHYARLGEELEKRREELVGKEGVEEEVLERQVEGLKKWVEAADKGCVEWGVLCFGR
ncbi:MAG: hypothetical protein Q9221_003480 [Calogaya cf. arnoldii]